MKKQTSCVPCSFQNKVTVLCSVLITGCYTAVPVQHAVPVYTAAISVRTPAYVFFGTLYWQHQGPYQDVVTLADPLQTAHITAILQDHQLFVRGTLEQHTLHTHQEISRLFTTLHMSAATYPAILHWIHGQPATDWPYHIVQQQPPCITFTQLSWYIQAQCTPYHTQRFLLQHATLLITIVPLQEPSHVPLACAC